MATSTHATTTSIPRPSRTDQNTAPLDYPLPEPPAPAPALHALRALAADAATRAAALLAGTTPTDPDPVVDLVRLDSDRDSWEFTDAALERAGLTAAQLRRLRIARRHGGDSFVHATLYTTQPDLTVIEAALTAIRPQRSAPRTALHADDNHITDHDAGIQIRLGPDTRWHPYTQDGETWAPAAGSNPDPAAAYRAALTARVNRRR
jgi:hypothetical protein